MTGEKWTLLAIAAAGGDPLTPVQLQKALFLLGKELPQVVGAGYYSFRPYNYGPFDSRVYDDAEELARGGFVDITPAPGRSWVQYAATPQGLEEAERLKESVDPAGIKYLASTVAWARRLSFPALVREIYAKYPEYREKSVFQD